MKNIKKKVNNIIELEEMSNDELLNLAKDLKKILKRRKTDIENAIKCVEESQGKYRFRFHAERKDERPYVAKLVYKFRNGFSNIDRIFENFMSIQNGRFIEVDGVFYANENDILEIRKSEGRAIYIVRDGELLYLCTSDDSDSMLAVKQAIKGDFGFDNLIELLTGNIDKGAILDELKD